MPTINDFSVENRDLVTGAVTMDSLVFLTASPGTKKTLGNVLNTGRTGKSYEEYFVFTNNTLDPDAFEHTPDASWRKWVTADYTPIENVESEVVKNVGTAYTNTKDEWYDVIKEDYDKINSGTAVLLYTIVPPSTLIKNKIDKFVKDSREWDFQAWIAGYTDDEFTPESVNPADGTMLPAASVYPVTYTYGRQENEKELGDYKATALGIDFVNSAYDRHLNTALKAIEDHGAFDAAVQPLANIFLQLLSDLETDETSHIDKDGLGRNMSMFDAANVFYALQKEGRSVYMTSAYSRGYVELMLTGQSWPVVDKIVDRMAYIRDEYTFENSFNFYHKKGIPQIFTELSTMRVPVTGLEIDNLNLANLSANGTVVGTVSAVSIVAEDQTWSLTDDASGRFAIDSDGVVTLIDTDNTTLGTYDITVQADDGVNTPVTETFQVNVVS